MFDGTDFERWMLKTLCGLAFSGHADISKAENPNWVPDVFWLKILFDGRPFPDRWGLYYAAESAGKIKGGVKVSVIANVNDGIYGVRILLDDELFLLLMDTSPEDLTETFLRRYTYRPKGIDLYNDYCRNVLLFGWNDQSQHTMGPIVKYLSKE